ncbi:hypothetical protein DFV88_24750 [Salmonella enterica subsp. enterica serovar Newport]|nr:hypothetical protein [Salmonella enterica subsp. enterica serovar Newport]
MIWLIWIAAGLVGGAIGFYGAWKVDKGGYELTASYLTSKPLKAVGVAFWIVAIYLTCKGFPGLLALVLALNVVWVWWLQDRSLVKKI